MGIHWTAALATGLKWQDDEHKELIRRINDLLIAMESHTVPKMVGGLFEFLDDYTHQHFAHEEDFMEQTQAPSRAGHIQAHEEFICRLRELQSVYARQGASTLVVMRLQRWLREWLLNHIARVDKALAVHARSRGIQP